MKMFWIFISVFLLISGLFSVDAQDMIVLRDGNIIEVKVTEISPTEIRYKRFEHLDGPTIVVPATNVLSIKYENGVLEIINTSPVVENEGSQTVVSGFIAEPQSAIPVPLQIILNAMPAVPVAGNNLKFYFNGDRWTTTVNGENFSAGTLEREDTNDGCMLTLKQTHIWPGAVGRTTGRIANMIPGGSNVGSALNTAGTITGAAGAIESSGPVIVLEYREGPPASFKLISNSESTIERKQEQARVTTDVENYNEKYDMWKYKVVFLGPVIGIGNIPFYYNHYNWFILNFGIVADFNIQPWLSLATGFNQGMIFGNEGYAVSSLLYIPLMLRFGYKPGRFELSGDLGFNFGLGLGMEFFIGFAFGSTMGFAIGVERGVVLNLGISYMPSGTILTGLEYDMLMVNAGIKFGIGNKRRR